MVPTARHQPDEQEQDAASWEGTWTRVSVTICTILTLFAILTESLDLSKSTIEQQYTLMQGFPILLPERPCFQGFHHSLLFYLTEFISSVLLPHQDHKHDTRFNEVCSEQRTFSVQQRLRSLALRWYTDPEDRVCVSVQMSYPLPGGVCWPRSSLQPRSGSTPRLASPQATEGTVWQRSQR